tara:strand:+ start:320 stop:547 length:228 start_codon:yes stop_codon:yes gene_type:complete
MYHKILIEIAFSPNLKLNIFKTVKLANMFDAELVGVRIGKKSNQKEVALKPLLSESDRLKKYKFIRNMMRFLYKK